MIFQILCAARNTVLCIAGAMLGCVAIRARLPLPPVPQVKEKLEWFRAHRDDYTALFLGTSRVRRHIIPSLFDQLAGEQGVTMHSFNLGVDSLAAPEDAYVLDQALEAAPPNLRYVFVELSYFRSNFSGQGPETSRAAYWHDWPRTLIVWQQLWKEDFRQIKPLRKHKRYRWKTWIPQMTNWLDMVVGHGRLFLQRATNLGRGAAMLEDWTGVHPFDSTLAPLGPGLDGFIPSSAGVVLHEPDLSEYERERKALETTPPRERTLGGVPLRNLQMMLARIRLHGAEPILFVAPTVKGLVFMPPPGLATVFDFSDSQRWPELFEPRYRADLGHLNTAGAEVFTRALAAQFFTITKLAAEQR